MKIWLTIPKNVKVILGGVRVKRFSICSLCMILLGGILISLSVTMESKVELTFLWGLTACLIGIIFSIVAFIKQEEGMLKVYSVCTFFIVLFLISWFEPFQLIRVLAWLKNMA